MHNKSIQIQELNQIFNQIIENLELQAKNKVHLHQVEQETFDSVLKIGSLFMQLFITEAKNSVENNCEKELYQHKDTRIRTLTTIFGDIEFERRKYKNLADHSYIYMLDKELGLGDNHFSFLLQDWIGCASTEMDYRSSTKYIGKIFGLKLHGMQADRMVDEMSEDVDLFYETESPKSADDCEFYAAGFDDKGVSIKASELGHPADSNGVRLGKGQKRGVKKHSTVSCTYGFDCRVRSAEDVVSSLFKEDDKDKIRENQQKHAINKHLRAFMSDKEKAISYGFDNIVKRQGNESKKIVVLIDGDRGLESTVDKVIESKSMLLQIEAKVLDIIHVTEYLWIAANAHFGEKSDHRLLWVKQQCLLLLKSEQKLVQDTLEKIKIANKVHPQKEKAIQKVLTYFKNHEHMMDYKTYLAKGYPISTGAVESACGHFVQTRMERNGMHWSFKGAQNMLDLRAVNKNEDWDNYMKFWVKQRQNLKHSQKQAT